MIASLRGIVLLRETDRVAVEAGGVGYELSVTSATAAQLDPGAQTFLHVVCSYGLYGGGQTLYGFLNPSEKAMFMAFKDHVPGTGAKKALEHLEKASKSLPDFRRAILEKDSKLLCGVFGFTKKTAQRLIDALSDKLDGLPAAGPERLARVAESGPAGRSLGQALNALAALGYKSGEARTALQAVAEEHPGRILEAEQIVRLALKKL